jgi:DNA-binding NarL/FixJ family response regulator
MADKPGKKIRIVIADDHPIFRDGLRKLLESEPGFEVVGEAADGAEVANVVRKTRPDILLLDLAMPRLPGLESLRQVAQAETNVHCILLTAAAQREQVLEALQLGARGVVLKESATQVLLKSIRCVMEGQYWRQRPRRGAAQRCGFPHRRKARAGLRHHRPRTRNYRRGHRRDVE